LGSNNVMYIPYIFDDSISQQTHVGHIKPYLPHHHYFDRVRVNHLLPLDRLRVSVPRFLRVLTMFSWLDSISKKTSVQLHVMGPTRVCMRCGVNCHYNFSNKSLRYVLAFSA
jgi:hypothetical protein